MSYPATLAQWNTRDHANTIELFPAQPFLVFQLAKDLDIPSILPSAMYCCSCTPDIKSLLDGILSVDGSHVDLEWEDKRTCLLARQQLYDAQRVRLFEGLLVHRGCGAPECDSGRLEYIRRLELKTIQAGCPCGFQIGFDTHLFGGAVCPECHDVGFESFLSARQGLWDDLPGLFGLPEWAQLVGGGPGGGVVEHRT